MTTAAHTMSTLPMSGHIPSHQVPKSPGSPAAPPPPDPFLAPPRRKNRRHGPDLLVRTITWLSLLGWGVLLLLLLTMDQAMPPVQTLFDRMMTPHPGGRAWNDTWTGWSLLLMGVLALIASWGLILNSQRHRRRSDRYSQSLIFLLLAALATLTLIVLFA